jgi:hypothetical protein
MTDDFEQKGRGVRDFEYIGKSESCHQRLTFLFRISHTSGLFSAFEIYLNCGVCIFSISRVAVNSDSFLGLTLPYFFCHIHSQEKWSLMLKKVITEKVFVRILLALNCQ